MTAVDLPLLHQELTAAGVIVPGLGNSEGTLETVHTYDAQGRIVPLPPEADPVLAAHVAPPRAIEYAGAVAVDRILATTDDQPHEVFRFPTVVKSVYRGTFTMTAVDRVAGTTRDTAARVVFKRTASALVQVGTTVVLSNAQDTQAASWAIIPTVNGTDLVISVKGALGRTIDWFLAGEIGRYAPEGLEA